MENEALLQAQSIVLAGQAIGAGYAVGKTIETIGRQPEIKGEVTPTMFVGCAVAETTGIYGLFVAIMLLFANPFLKYLG